MVKIHMMKAQEGDFIWLSYGDMEKEYHLLIDGGVKDCRERYADVVRSISAKGESIEAIILTHIDCDHIAGACEGIAKVDAGILQRTVKKIIFNASKKIHKEILVSKNSGEYGVKEGIEFCKILKEKGIYDRIVERTIAGEIINLENGALLKVISPGEKQLEQLLDKPKIVLYCNYDWWESQYHNKYFTQKDRQLYIDTGVLKINLLGGEGTSVKDGLILYGK